MLVILALQRWSQENDKFMAIFRYIEFEVSLATVEFQATIGYRTH